VLIRVAKRSVFVRFSRPFEVRVRPSTWLRRRWCASGLLCTMLVNCSSIDNLGLSDHPWVLGRNSYFYGSVSGTWTVHGFLKLADKTCWQSKCRTIRNSIEMSYSTILNIDLQIRYLTYVNRSTNAHWVVTYTTSITPQAFAHVRPCWVLYVLTNCWLTYVNLRRTMLLMRKQTMRNRSYASTYRPTRR